MKCLGADGTPCDQPATHLVWWNWANRKDSPTTSPDFLCDIHANYWRRAHRARRGLLIERLPPS